MFKAGFLGFWCLRLCRGVLCLAVGMNLTTVLRKGSDFLEKLLNIKLSEFRLYEFQHFALVSKCIILLTN